MSKALIFSDLHAHSHKDRVARLQDCVCALNWVFEQAAAHNCDYIFFLGDLFHERTKIDVLNYLRVFEVFMKHMIEDACGREVYLLVGNHDMYHREKWDVNSIKPLTAIPGISIIQTPLSFSAGGKQFDCLPHTENPVAALDALKKARDGKTGDILLSHLAVNGALTNTYYGVRSDVIVEYDNEMVPVDPGVFSDWEMVFLGHYHAAQKIGHAEYVGSPLQISFGEAFQTKHVIILDLDTLEKTYVVNDFSPKHLIITPQDIEHENYSLTGNFVRIAVEDMGQRDLSDLQRKIEKECRPLSLDMKPRDKTSEEKEANILSESIQTARGSIKERLEVWMQERGLPDKMDWDQCLQIGMQCLSREAEIPK